MSIITPSITYYPDPTKGRPVFNGYIYVGEPDLDPQIPSNQKQASLKLEDGTTIPIGQPIRTGPGGVVIHNGSYAVVVADGDYSVKVLNSEMSQVYYVPSNSGIFDASQISIVVNGLQRTSVQSYLENKEVADYAELRALPSAQLADGDDIRVEDLPGTWQVESGSETDDGATILVFSDDTGRYARLLDVFTLLPEHFGAKGDKVADDTTALQNFFNYYKSINAAQPNTTPTCDLKKGSVYYVTSQVVAENFGIRGNGAVIYTDQDIGILRTVGSGNVYEDFVCRYESSTSSSLKEGITLANYPTTNEQNAKNIWKNVVVRNPYRGFVWRGGSGSQGGTAANTFIHCRVDFNWDWGFYAECSTGTTTLTMINCQQFGSLAGGSTQIKGFYINNCADVALLGTTSVDQVYDGLALQITGAKTVKVDMLVLESCVLRSDLSRMVDINGADVTIGPIHSKVGTFDLPSSGDEAYMLQVGATTKTLNADIITKTNTVSTTGTIYDLRMANNVLVNGKHIDLANVQTNGLYSQFYNFGDFEGYSNSFANLPAAARERRVMVNRSPSPGEAGQWIDDGSSFHAGYVIQGGSVVTATTSQFADITHAVNTQGKWAGKVVPDTTTGLQMQATGSAAGSAWQPSDGGAVTTPS